MDAGGSSGSSGSSVWAVRKTVLSLLKLCLSVVGCEGEVRTGVKRGLGYYVEDGFEVWAKDLQIAGGGRYPEGIGWAIGIDRLLLVSQVEPAPK
jgi:histidyl-tRNA synthetase